MLSSLTKPDVTHKEQLCIKIRWVDNNDFVIHEDPLELINVPKTDSDTQRVLRYKRGAG